jgi:hypothetical protein
MPDSMEIMIMAQPKSDIKNAVEKINNSKNLNEYLNEVKEMNEAMNEWQQRLFDILTEPLKEIHDYLDGNETMNFLDDQEIHDELCDHEDPDQAISDLIQLFRKTVQSSWPETKKQILLDLENLDTLLRHADYTRAKHCAKKPGE